MVVVLRVENRVIDFNGNEARVTAAVSCFALSAPETRGGYSRPVVKKSSPRSPEDGEEIDRPKREKSHLISRGLFLRLSVGKNSDSNGLL